MKKIFFLTFLTALVFLLISCSDNTLSSDDASSDNINVTGSEYEEVPYDRSLLKEELPADKYYNGYEFRMFLRKDAEWFDDMYSDVMTGEIVNDAIYYRNNAVEEKFGIKFTAFSNPGEESWNPGDAAAKTILAGDAAYDIVVPHARYAFSAYAQQHLVLNWNVDLPYVDLNKQWWDQDAKNSLAIYDKLYAMTGDISYMSVGASNCMLFNKKLFNDLIIDYPYQTVLDNKWTFDKFEEIAKLGSRDVNGDGILDLNDDQFGYVTYQWIGPIQILYVGGGRILDKDREGNPYLSINTERNIAVYERYFKMLDSEYAAMQYNVGDAIFEHYDTFRAGRAIFIDMNIKTISLFRDMKDDYGIIPWPKFDESIEKYRSGQKGKDMI